MATSAESEGRFSPSWLTATLRRAGALPNGTVATVESRGNDAFNSTITHLTLTYTAEAPPSAPRRLLLKRNLPADWAVRAGEREVRFYQAAATMPRDLPMLIPCFDAAFDRSTGEGYLLLLDVSETHRQPMTRDQQLMPGANVPDEADSLRVVETLARFHAHWWERPPLGGDVASLGALRFDAAIFRDYVGRVAKAWDAMLRAESSRLPSNARRVYDELLLRWSLLWNRYLGPRYDEPRRITLIHGDAYFANFLCPIDQAGGQTYLIDWQCPEVGFGPSDLANLLATFWTPDQRRQSRREERLLRRYHEVLLAAGVADYRWADMMTDYRLGVTIWLLVPLQDFADGASPSYWLPKMRCLLGAYEDLRCGDLLADG